MTDGGYAYHSLDIPSKRWSRAHAPRRILAIRLQAMGDLVITLPYLQSLKNSLPPGGRLDLLTREEVASIPKSIELFDRVFAIGGGRNTKKQLAHSMLLLPRLWARRYDMVIDLQNNIVSNLIRKSLKPKAWSEFDRFSPVPAGESTRLTIEAAGVETCGADTQFKTSTTWPEMAGILEQNGWDGRSRLVVLNPAGAFENRNWPVENYNKFARLWLQDFPETQFVTLGVNFIHKKALYLQQNLGGKIINLVNKTTPAEAFALLQYAQLVVSEDSGLMHMAWVSGIPTLGLFGSTSAARATPLGDHTMLLHSSDLPCGNCMLDKCIHGDNRCLTRYSPAFVAEKARSLLNRFEKSSRSPLPGYMI